MDIYQFPLPEKIKPSPVTYLKGIVFDKTNNRPLEAQFELVDLDSKKTVFNSYSNYNDGEFFVCLPAGHE